MRAHFSRALWYYQTCQALSREKVAFKRRETLKSFMFQCISKPCYSVNNLPLRSQMCFRFDRRDVVTTQSVCGHLCHHHWHSAQCVVGNVVFSYPRKSLRYFRAMTWRLLTPKWVLRGPLTLAEILPRPTQPKGKNFIVFSSLGLFYMCLQVYTYVPLSFIVMSQLGCRDWPTYLFNPLQYSVIQ